MLNSPHWIWLAAQTTSMWRSIDLRKPTSKIINQLALNWKDVVLQCIYIVVTSARSTHADADGIWWDGFKKQTQKCDGLRVYDPKYITICGSSGIEVLPMPTIWLCPRFLDQLQSMPINTIQGYSRPCLMITLPTRYTDVYSNHYSLSGHLRPYRFSKWMNSIFLQASKYGY